MVSVIRRRSIIAVAASAPAWPLAGARAQGKTGSAVYPVAVPTYEVQFVAQERGFFKDEGYDFKLIQGGNGVKTREIMASRQADFAIADILHVLQLNKNGRPTLTKEPKLLLNDNDAGKPEGIHLIIGRRPHAAFGNSTGDRQMLEYAGAGDGARLAMLVLHDDATREYAYGPARGLPDTKVGTFTQVLYDEAQNHKASLVVVLPKWTPGAPRKKRPDWLASVTLASPVEIRRVLGSVGLADRAERIEHGGLAARQDHRCQQDAPTRRQGNPVIASSHRPSADPPRMKPALTVMAGPGPAIHEGTSWILRNAAPHRRVGRIANMNQVFAFFA